MPTSLDTYAPFDTGAGANVTEATWRKMMRHVFGDSARGSGVVRRIANTCAVFADSSGLQVKVNTGEVWIRGHWGECTATKTLPLATADPANARNDRIVARADFVNNRVEFDVLTGTPSGSPAVPGLTQNSSIWEVSLGIVNVPATDTVIDAGQVTDSRHYLDDKLIQAIKTTDNPATSDTAPDIDAELTIPLSANATYRLLGFWMFDGVVAADAKVRLTGPPGATAAISPKSMGLGVPAAQTFDSIVSNTVGFSTDMGIGTYNAGAGNISVAAPIAYITTGNTAGDLATLFSQQTSSGTATTLRIGSFNELSRIG